MFDLLTWVILALTAAGMVYAYATSRDSLHPLIVMAPMFGFVYGWMPLRLSLSNGLDAFFTRDQLLFVECLNLAGTAAFLFGCLYGGRNRNDSRGTRIELTPNAVRIALLAAAFSGFLGMVAWAKGIWNVGGIRSAFGRAYGGGWEGNGYVREAMMLTITGIVLFQLELQRRPKYLRHFLIVGTLAMPVAIQGLLGARRSPTFILCVVLVAGFFLNRNRRPAIVPLTLGGIVLGYVLLLLVANRDRIYIGSDFDLSTDVSSYAEGSNAGNEFIYGTGAVLNAKESGRYYWGERYLIYLVIRPIPKELWPTKYQDVGRPELLVNAGTGGEEFQSTLGWSGAIGAAPGIIADLWIEMSWLAVGALWLLGWWYGMTWRNAASRGGAWVPQYIIMLALSLYLVLQSLEACVIRVIILSAPLWIAWVWMNRRMKAERDAEAVYAVSMRTGAAPLA